MPLPPGPMTPVQVFHLLKLVPPSKSPVNPTHNFGKELLAHLSRSSAQSAAVQSGHQTSLISGLSRPNLFVPFAPETGPAAGGKNSTSKGSGKTSSGAKDKRKKGPPSIA